MITHLLKYLKDSKLSLVLSGIILFILVSCEFNSDYEKAEKEAINDYLKNNPDLEYELKSSGLYYLEIDPGSGEQADKNDTAYLKYRAILLDETPFETNIREDSSVDTLIVPVNAGKLIAGFDEGLTYMREGGRSMLLLPSSLAYGSSNYLAHTSYGYINLRGFTPILIDVYLLKLKLGP